MIIAKTNNETFEYILGHAANNAYDSNHMKEVILPA